MYKIEKNVAVLRLATKYPFSEMEIGDSFLVPKSERHAVRSSAISFSAVLHRREPAESDANGRFAIGTRTTIESGALSNPQLKSGTRQVKASPFSSRAGATPY